MKYSMLWKNTEEVYNCGKKLYGKRGQMGAVLRDMSKVDTKRLLGGGQRCGIAFCYEGSGLSYLYFKVRYDLIEKTNTVIRGWL